MRGSDKTSGSLFSYVDVGVRIPTKHPLRTIRRIVNEVLVSLDPELAKLYEATGRGSTPPEWLLRASLLQAFYSIRSERQLMAQLDYDLLFRWFVGLGVDDAVWDHSTFSKNRDCCWRPRWRPSSWKRCCATPRSSVSCRTITSRSGWKHASGTTARWWKPGLP